MSLPIFSIVIPCYNQGAFLQECLLSIVNQYVEDWEAIVVDDASPCSESERVVRQVNDPRIQFVRHDNNLGLGAARNTGFRLTRGPLVLPVDADDFISPIFLQRVGNALLARPEIDAASVNFQLFGTRSEVWQFPSADSMTMTRRQWMPGAGILMRRSLWERVGGYCESPTLRSGNEDWDFWLGAAGVGFSAIHIPESLYFYRKHEASLMASLHVNDYKTREFIYKRHRHLFDCYGSGRDFLYVGYQNSIHAAIDSNNRRRAFMLAARGWRQTQKSRLVRSAIKSLIPRSCLKILIDLGSSKAPSRTL